MTESITWRWHDKIACRNIGDETVVVGIESNEVHVLNEVGAFLWQNLEHGADTNTLLSRLRETYEVGENQALADIDQFLSELVAKKLITTAVQR